MGAPSELQFILPRHTVSLISRICHSGMLTSKFSLTDRSKLYFFREKSFHGENDLDHHGLFTWYIFLHSDKKVRQQPMSNFRQKRLAVGLLRALALWSSASSS